MAWHNAPSVAAALAEATRRWPHRSHESDGTIGDAAHSARESDHNPAANGIVHAFDLTHDPAHGVDCEQLASHLVSVRDHRVKYIIWNKQICNSTNWTWQHYSGTNPHTKHMHVSILATSQAENDTSDWWADQATDEVTAVVEYIVREMNRNSAGADVRNMKELNSFSAGQSIADFQKLPWWKQLLGLGLFPESYAMKLSSKAAALVAWAMLVRQDGPWDHKPYIRRTFHSRVPGGEQVWHIHGKYVYYYDIWSNIHYGYVGTAAGFTRSELLDGAGLEQIGSDMIRGKLPRVSVGVQGLRKWDDASDRAAITIGIKLCRAHPIGLTTQAVLKEVESSPQLKKKPYP